VPEQVTDPDDQDLHRGFFFHNTEGEQQEAWFHVFGCRRWSYLTRNTAEDRVVGRSH
jgi:sarcosine oxidase delta subunit